MRLLLFITLSLIQTAAKGTGSYELRSRPCYQSEQINGLANYYLETAEDYWWTSENSKAAEYYDLAANTKAVSDQYMQLRIEFGQIKLKIVDLDLCEAENDLQFLRYKVLQHCGQSNRLYMAV